MPYIVALISLILAGFWVFERLAPNTIPYIPLGGDETTQTAIILMIGFMLLTIVSLWELRNGRKK